MVSKLMLWIGLALVVLVAGGWFAIFQPFAVIDPNESGFDPERFRFLQYDSQIKDFRIVGGNKTFLLEALLKMFHPGTDKAYVENILVDHAGMTKSEKPYTYDGKLVWNYRLDVGEGGFIININYDERDRTRTFYFADAGKLYGPDIIPAYAGTEPTLQAAYQKTQKQQYDNYQRILQKFHGAK